MGKLKAVLHADNLGEGPEGFSKSLYPFELLGKSYQVRISERWNLVLDGSRVKKVDVRGSYSVQYRTNVKGPNGIEDGYFAVDPSNKAIVGKSAPQALILLADAEDEAPIAVKAVRADYGATGHGHMGLLEAEIKLSRDLYPEANRSLPTPKPFYFEHRGIPYYGLAQERVIGVPLNQAVDYIKKHESDKRLMVEKIIRLYQAVLAEYQRIGRIPSDVSHGNIFVRAKHDPSNPKKLVPILGKDGREAQIRALDCLDGFCKGGLKGDTGRRTHSSADESLFLQNDYARVTFSCLHALHAMLRRDLERVGCSSDVLRKMGVAFRPDMVVTDSNNHRVAMSMFSFYGTLLDEMLAANQGQPKAVALSAENPVVQFVWKKLEKVNKLLDHVLERADSSDYAYSAVRHYRKKTKEMPKTASELMAAMDEANNVVAKVRNLSKEGKFVHQKHADYRAGGKLALSQNKGAIAGIVLGIFLGGVIPALIALFVLIGLEKQKTARQQQLEAVLGVLKKVPEVLTRADEEPTRSFLPQSGKSSSLRHARAPWFRGTPKAADSKPSCFDGPGASFLS